MAKKLTIAFLFFVVIVLILFGVFVGLMTTVNPSRDPSLNNSAPGAKPDDTETEEPPYLEDIDQEPMKSLESADQSSTEKNKALKGRRSIGDSSRTRDDGVVVMRVVDNEGRPIIEVVMYPKYPSSNWEVYKMENVLDLGHSEFEPVKRVRIPEDTFVIKKEQSSNNLDGRSDSSDNSKMTKDVSKMESNETNSNKINDYDQEVTIAKLISRPKNENTMQFEGSGNTIDELFKTRSSENEQANMDKAFTKQHSDNEFVRNPSMFPFNIASWSQNNSWTNKSIDFDKILDAKIKVSLPESTSDNKIIKTTIINTETETLNIIGEKTSDPFISDDPQDKLETIGSFNNSATNLFSYSMIGENKSEFTNEISNVTPLDVNLGNNFTDATINISTEPIIDEDVKVTDPKNLNIDNKTTTVTISNEWKIREPIIPWQGLANSSIRKKFNQPGIHTMPISKINDEEHSGNNFTDDTSNVFSTVAMRNQNKDVTVTSNLNITAT